MGSLTKKLQNFGKYFGVHISRKPLKYYYELENEISDSFIKFANSVLHIGAHYGQEASNYHKLEKDVLWIEALPDVYKILKSKIEIYPKQRAICALLGANQNESVDYYLTNNDNSASSIYKLDPDSGFNNVINTGIKKMRTSRLDNLISLETLNKYDHWVLDVQGAELDVLKGAGQLLKYVFSIQIEVSTRSTYINGAQFNQIEDFLRTFGFFPIWQPLQNDHTNIVFVNKKQKNMD